jgi:DNA-binding XRE family transcriptional regulator
MKGKTLQELRLELGMTQRDLAKALELGPSTIAMYELGLRTPSLDTAKKIAKYFMIPVDNIFFGNDVRTKRATSTGTEGN